MFPNKCISQPVVRNLSLIVRKEEGDGGQNPFYYCVEKNTTKASHDPMKNGWMVGWLVGWLDGWWLVVGGWLDGDPLAANLVSARQSGQ